MRVALLLCLLTSIAHAAPVDSTGTVQGTVVFRSDGSPGAYANVIVIGTRRGTQADELGRFRIEGIPLGRQLVRTLVPGSDARTDTIEIVALGKPIELRVALEGTPPPAQIRIGSKTPASDSDFVATIRPAVRFHVGDQAKFDVRIQNRGSSPAFLVRRVDGSSSPAVWIAIVGPPQGLYEVGRTLSGNSNGVQAADFVEVLPGASFDPFKGSNLAHGRFNAPGRYTATFRYMTTNTAPAMWQDDSCQRCDVSEEMRALLERVPMLDLIALITFEVEP